MNFFQFPRSLKIILGWREFRTWENSTSFNCTSKDRSLPRSAVQETSPRRKGLYFIRTGTENSVVGFSEPELALINLRRNSRNKIERGEEWMVT